MENKCIWILCLVRLFTLMSCSWFRVCLWVAFCNHVSTLWWLKGSVGQSADFKTWNRGVSKLFPLCYGVCCGFVFSGQNVAQLHVGYSKYPKEQLQSFREDVILANHAHVSLLWPSSAQNQTCTAVLLWWPLVKTEAAKSSLLSFKLGTSGLINYNFVIMLLSNTCYAIGNPGYFPVNVVTFVVWAADLSMWVAPMRNLPNLCQWQTAYSAINSCLVVFIGIGRL